MATKDSATATFTARDFELLASAMSCTKAPIEVDYKKFAEKAGFKGAPSAKASWNTLKKKLEKMAGGSVAPSLTISGDDDADGGKKAKGGKKRKASSDDEDDEDQEAEEEVKEEPAKRSKKGRKAAATYSKAKKAKSAPAVDEDQDEEEDAAGPVKAEVEG